MSALVIDYPFTVEPRSQRPVAARPTARPRQPHAGGAPSVGTVADAARRGRARACSVPAPQAVGVADQPNIGEWHLTPRGVAVVGALMTLTMLLGLVTVVVQYLSIPA